MNNREWYISNYNLTDEQWDKLLEISRDLHVAGLSTEDTLRDLVNGIFKPLDEMNKQMGIMINGTGTDEPIGFLNSEQA